MFKGLLPKLRGLAHYFYDCKYECPLITVTRIMSAWWLCPIYDTTSVCLIMQEMRKSLFGETTNENKQISIIMILELKTLEWDILNPDRIINLEIKNERRTSNI